MDVKEAWLRVAGRGEGVVAMERLLVRGDEGVVEALGVVTVPDTWRLGVKVERGIWMRVGEATLVDVCDFKAFEEPTFGDDFFDVMLVLGVESFVPEDTSMLSVRHRLSVPDFRAWGKSFAVDSNWL